MTIKIKNFKQNLKKKHNKKGDIVKLQKDG